MTNKKLGLLISGIICILLVIYLIFSRSCSSDNVYNNSEDGAEEDLSSIDQITDSGSEVADNIERDIINSLYEILGSEENSFAGVTVLGLDEDFEVDFNSEKMECASIIKMFIATCVYENLEDLIDAGYKKSDIDLYV